MDKPSDCLRHCGKWDNNGLHPQAVDIVEEGRPNLYTTVIIVPEAIVNKLLAIDLQRLYRNFVLEHLGEMWAKARLIASFGVLEHQKDMTYTCRLWLAYRIPEGPEEGSGSMGHCVVRLPSQRPLDKRTGPVTWPQDERSNDSRTLVNPDDDFTHIFSNAAHETCAEHKKSETKRTKIRNDAIHDEPVVDDTLKKAILDLVEDTKAKKAIFVHEQSDKALRHNISARNARGFQHAAGSDRVQDTRSRSRSTGRVTPGRPQGRSPSTHKHNQAQSLSEARQKQHVTVAEGFTSTSEAKTERLLR